MINFLKKMAFTRNLYRCCKFMVNEFRFKHVKNFLWYFSDLRKLNKKINENFKELKIYPCLGDKTSLTPIDPVYFYQDTWAAKKIFELKLTHHHDVGSSVKTIGILSQFVPITMVDIRPLPLQIDNLNFIEGSILELPFEDNSLESISSLCVVEHIGLGRYGDIVDAFGSEKSIIELKRVVNIGGVIIFSVPVDSINTIYFNAHRAFTRSYVITMFDGFELVEEKYQYGYSLVDEYNPKLGFGTGLYLFRKIQN